MNPEQTRNDNDETKRQIHGNVLEITDEEMGTIKD